MTLSELGLPSALPNVAWLLGDSALPAHIDPERDALQWVGGTRTYAELRARSRALAKSLETAGVVPGDRVASFLLNRGEIFELYFACAYAGATLVPMNFRFTSREVGYVLDDAEPRVVFTQDDLLPTLNDAVADGRAGLHVVVLGDGAAGDDYEALAAADHEGLVARSTEVQMILYTSGTTGRPKGVEMTQQSVMWCSFQQALYYGMNSSTVTMLTGPMYNTAAMNEQSIPTFMSGGTVTIMPSRGWTPAAMSEFMDDWKVTHALIYPSMIEPMLAADAENRIQLETLRFVLTGGENCPPETMRKFMKRWPHLSLCIGYGSTESGIASLIRDDEIVSHPASVGRATGGQLIAVVDDEGKPVPTDTSGRVWTAGPAITSGYWRAPDLTSDVLRDGWLETGDRGRVDASGYLYIEGRTKDMIISKGQNVYPAEIENTIREHSAIADVAVIGVPDAEAGEAVCAVVIVHRESTLTGDELIAFVKERIASYKKPKHVIFRTSIPRSASGKVLKSDLVTSVLEQMGIQS